MKVKLVLKNGINSAKPVHMPKCINNVNCYLLRESHI